MTETPDITSTLDPTTDWLGRTYIERSDYWNLAKGGTIPASAKRWLVRYVEPCNEWYYKMTGADASIPRWDVTVQRLRADGSLGTKITSFALTADAEIV